jgi:predicted Zn-dependent peptidase
MTILEHIYPNGFRIIYEKSLHSIPITGAFVFCDIGSVHEYDELRGASHFIEHMCFKGTKQIPNSNDIFSEYSKIGAYFNATTTKRYTCFTIKCQDQYLENSLAIVSDMMMNSTFKKKEFEKEHKVVIEENNNNNDPPNILYDESERILFKGSAYEYPIDELEYHNKGTLSYDKVLDFYRSFYHPSNMFVSIVSHIPFEKIKLMLKKTYFLKEKTRFTPTIKPVIQLKLEPFSDIQYKLIEKKGVPNVSLLIGFRTCPHNSIEKFYLKLLSIIMGGGFTGRMMKLLREKHGLVYSARCTIRNYEHTGKFIFYTETNPENFLSHGKTTGVLQFIMKMINNMKRSGITDEEIKLAKGNLKGSNMLDLESLSLHTNYNGEELLFIGGAKQIVPYAKLYDTYFDKITKKDILAVIKKYFIRENMCVCVVAENKLDLSKIKKECETLI